VPCNENGNGLWICEESEVTEIKADEYLTTELLMLHGLGFDSSTKDTGRRVRGTRLGFRKRFL
jgi:hypothetical protein